jgi:hypothetical protein
MSSTPDDLQTNKNQAPVTPGLTSYHNNNSNYDDLNNSELCVLTALALNTIKECGIPHVLPFTQQQPRQPDIFKNAKIEQIICSGLKPQYDRSPDKLLQTLNLIHIHHKNKVLLGCS